VTRFKHRVRELTRRHRGVSLEKMIADLNPFVRGWAGYFGFSQWRELPSLDGWIRRRLRCVGWVQWKTRGQRYRELRRLKVPERSASAAIFCPKGPWRLTFSEALHRAFTKARFRRLGLTSMEKLASAKSAEPPWYGPVCPVVWEGWHREMPPSRLTERARC
jgi:RNA-directed DNA polymerase